MSEKGKVENIFEEAQKTSGQVPVIFTGVEAVPVATANVTDIQDTHGGEVLIRFFYQKPIRRAESAAKLYPDGSMEYESLPDTIEFALQASVSMPRRVAAILKEQLNQLFAVAEEQDML